MVKEGCPSASLLFRFSVVRGAVFSARAALQCEVLFSEASPTTENSMAENHRPKQNGLPATGDNYAASPKQSDVDPPSLPATASSSYMYHSHGSPSGSSLAGSRVTDGPPPARNKSCSASSRHSQGRLLSAQQQIEQGQPSPQTSVSSDEVPSSAGSNGRRCSAPDAYPLRHDPEPQPANPAAAAGAVPSPSTNGTQATRLSHGSFFQKEWTPPPQDNSNYYNGSSRKEQIQSGQDLQSCNPFSTAFSSTVFPYPSPASTLCQAADASAPGTANDMISISQNGHHPFPVPQMTISQPSACISFQPSTLPAAPVTQMPAAAAAAACGGLQPAPPYLQAVHAPQPVTLTIRQPNLISPPPVAAPAPVVQSDQAVPPPLSQGPGSSSASPNTPRHIRDQTPSSFSSYSEGSDASSRHNGGGFTLEDMSNLWNHPPQPNGHHLANGYPNSFSDPSPENSPPTLRKGSPPPDATGKYGQLSALRLPKPNPPLREFPLEDDGQLTITVKAGREDDDQLSRMCTVHPRTRDIRIRRLERLPSHRRHFRCETCTEILQDFADQFGLYPSEEQKQQLLMQVGMTPTALGYWFANRRRAATNALLINKKKIRKQPRK